MSSLNVILPDGRSVGIAPAARGLLRCGLLALDPVSVFPNPEVATATSSLGEELRARYGSLLPSQIPELAEARSLYKNFNMDPSRHRPSSEALLRRLLKGKDLYQINNAVDSCNLACLNFLLPAGMYDLQEVQGDVVLQAGKEGDAYAGIRKGPVNLAGRLGLFDARGPFGSPTSDSFRTRVTEQTTKILAVVMATGQYPIPSMHLALDIFSGLFGRYCNATEAFRAVLEGER